MPSSLKTTNLELNKWIESDHPVRADFISDNEIIDSVLGGHLANSGVHLTAAEKQRVGSPFAVYAIQGTGEQSRAITLDFSPQMVFYFAQDMPLSEFTGSIQKINGGIAVKNYGNSEGCSIGSNIVYVVQQDINGVRYNLNKENGQYILVAFR